jgi:hypothetical protein
MNIARKHGRSKLLSGVAEIQMDNKRFRREHSIQNLRETFRTKDSDMVPHMCTVRTTTFDAKEVLRVADLMKHEVFEHDVKVS